MASRPQAKTPVIVNGDMTLALTGLVTIIDKISMMSYTLSWAGTSPVGTISVQVSNDFALNAAGGVATAGTWNTLPLGLNGSTVSSIPISGNTGEGAIDIETLGLYAIRLVYTPASGTGTLQAVFNGKVA